MLEINPYDTTECDGWLVPVATNAHEGDCLDVLYYFDQTLPLHIKSPSKGLSVYSVTPDGKRQYLDVINSGEDHCTYRIQINKKGLYHLVAKQNRYISKDAEGRCFSGTFEDNPDAVTAMRYLNYAHTTLQVGSNFESSNRSETLMPPLCIIPSRWNGFRVGEVFSFTLYFMDRPLPLYDIDIFRLTEKGVAIHEKYITNGDGRMLYPLNTVGKYLLSVCCISPECKEESYYNTRYTYTFWFKAEDVSSTTSEETP